MRSPKQMSASSAVLAVHGTLAALVILAAAANPAAAQPIELGGVTCQTPAPEHCPDQECPTEVVISAGTAIEPKTTRPFFLDYPCDLKIGDEVTFILSLHGGGSYGNWQRHYFPIVDYKDSYHLVIATPNAPPRVWGEVDDEYLQNIVELVHQDLAKHQVKVRTFWLAGHSQGGMTSNRLLRTDFFKKRVDGWLSLSGGRLGGSPGRADFGIRPPTRPAAAGDSTTPAAPPSDADAEAAARRFAAARAALQELPDADFSFIFETGQHEMDDQGLPMASTWAEKYGCGKPVARGEVTDTKAGYVWDPTRQDPGSAAWGRAPRPGNAEIRQYSDCKGGRVVADIVRLDKGHTEGLEPRITEEIVKLMLTAPKK